MRLLLTVPLDSFFQRNPGWSMDQKYQITAHSDFPSTGLLPQTPGMCLAPCTANLQLLETTTAAPAWRVQQRRSPHSFSVCDLSFAYPACTKIVYNSHPYKLHTAGDVYRIRVIRPS